MVGIFFAFKKPGHGGLFDAAINFALFTGWGLIHSLFARSFVKRIIANLVGEDFAKLTYITIAGITQCLVLYYWRPLSGILWETHGIVYWILTGLFGLSLLSVFGSSLILDYMEVLGIRRLIRRLRNEPSKPITLCTKGPYAYCAYSGISVDYSLLMDRTNNDYR